METIKIKIEVDGLKAKELATVDPDWEKELEEGINMLIGRMYKKENRSQSA